MNEGSELSSAVDAELVEQTCEGNTEAFAVLVQRYQNLICSIAYSLVGDFVVSEDIAQEAFIAAWKDIGSLKEPEKFKPWLCAITRNKSLNTNRKKKPLLSQDMEQAPHESTHLPEQQAMIDDENEFIWKTLSSLPVQYREPLVLYYRQEQSVAEVASLLDLSTDAVKQRLARGRAMLKSELLASIGTRIRETAPKAAFTATVLATISSFGVKSAIAGGVAGGECCSRKGSTGRKGWSRCDCSFKHNSGTCTWFIWWVNGRLGAVVNLTL